jgi:hypothetical protein
LLCPPRAVDIGRVGAEGRFPLPKTLVQLGSIRLLGPVPYRAAMNETVVEPRPMKLHWGSTNRGLSRVIGRRTAITMAQRSKLQSVEVPPSRRMMSPVNVLGDHELPP